MRVVEGRDRHRQHAPPTSAGAPEVPLATIEVMADPELPGGWLPPAGARRPAPAAPRPSSSQPPTFVHPSGRSRAPTGSRSPRIVCAVSSLGLLVLSLGLSFFFSLPLGVAGWVCAARSDPELNPGAAQDRPRPQHRRRRAQRHRRGRVGDPDRRRLQRRGAPAQPRAGARAAATAVVANLNAVTPNPFVKQYLMTAGPTPVPPAVSQAMAAPMLYHRAPAFVELYERVLGKLPRVFQTENDVLVFAASGSGAMESAAANLVRPGKPVLAAAAGKFGERWIELAEAYGGELVRYEPGWGERLDPAEFDRLLSENPEIDVAFATLSETCTGIVHDVQAIAEVCKRHDVILAVDAVSGLGAAELRQDEWGIDVVVAGSQKALMCPPGLAFASVSDKARRLRRRASPAAATTSTGARTSRPSARATPPSRPPCRCSSASTSRST